MMARFSSSFPFFVCMCASSFLIGGFATEQKTMNELKYEITYGTFLGGSEFDQAREIILYPDGSVLVAGQSSSSNFPTTPGVFQPQYAGDDPALGHGGIYGGDCFLTRLSPDGQRILLSTYFGGSKQERNVYGMAIDKQGNIVITSMTRSPDVPTTTGCFQPKYGGGPSDWFVAKLSSDCKRLVWCTYIGGSGDDSPRGGLTLDGQDNIYVVGTTASSNFPTTPGAFQRNLKGTNDAALVKVKTDGSGVVFSTLLGGSNSDGTMIGVRVNASGNVYLVGHTESADFPVTANAAQARLGGQSDCYFAEFSSAASRLAYSTYLGGSQNEFAEHQPWLAPDGTMLLTGSVSSPDFPSTKGVFQRLLKGTSDGFLTKLSADGRSFIFSTFVGGSGGDFFLMPTVDAQGNIFIVGQTGSQDFPVTADSFQASYGGGQSDGVMAVFSPDGTKLVYATYLGGSGEDMIRSLTLGPNGEVYLVGSTSSSDFPVMSNAAQTGPGGKEDAFVVKLMPRVVSDSDSDGLRGMRYACGLSRKARKRVRSARLLQVGPRTQRGQTKQPIFAVTGRSQFCPAGAKQALADLE